MENMEVIERKISLPTSEHPGEGMEEFQYKEADLSDTLEAFKAHDDLEREKDLNEQKGQNTGVYLNPANENSSTENVSCEEKEAEPVFDGTEIPELEARNLVPCSLENVPDGQGSAWPEKAVALKNFVKAKSTIAVSTVLRHLSVKKGEDEQVLSDNQHNNATTGVYMCEESPPEAKLKENIQKIGEWPTWKPLSFVKIGRDAESDLKTGQTEATHVEHSLEEPAMKRRIIIYTGLGCNESKEVRLFMHQKRLKYIEINVDIFPNRKQALEKYVGSSSVPMIFFNDIPIGGLSELKALDDLGDLAERIKALEEEPSPSAPFPPLPGEDDISGSGMIDELASIVRKMKESIILKDRFYKMRRFSNCFLGSEAVDFLSEDQYLEREEAVEFGRKLVSKYLFHHVLEENIFEDGSYLYRFLEHDPVISQCYNIPRGISDVTTKPITEIAS